MSLVLIILNRKLRSYFLRIVKNWVLLYCANGQLTTKVLPQLSRNESLTKTGPWNFAQHKDIKKSEEREKITRWETSSWSYCSLQVSEREMDGGVMQRREKRNTEFQVQTPSKKVTRQT
jgi:hypothetical protein